MTTPAMDEYAFLSLNTEEESLHRLRQTLNQQQQHGASFSPSSSSSPPSTSSYLAFIRSKLLPGAQADAFSQAIDALWLQDFNASNPANMSVASATTRDVNESATAGGGDDDDDDNDDDDLDFAEIIPHSALSVSGGFCGNLDVGTLQVDNFFSEDDASSAYVPSMLSAQEAAPAKTSMTDLLADAVERAYHASLPSAHVDLHQQHVVDIVCDDDDDDEEEEEEVEEGNGDADDDALDFHGLPLRAREALLAMMKHGLNDGAAGAGDETDDEDGDEDDNNAVESFVVRDFNSS